jgi:isopropylmalate/homocitrate/citramalate synthase
VAVHCHDDYGLATASTLEAVKVGAEVVDCVVNGLGDRAGNAPLEEVVTALTVLYGVDTGVKIEGLYPLSKLVEEVYGVPIAPNKALVGVNQYNHATDSHIVDIIKGEWFTWENIRAEALGQKRVLEFGSTALSRQLSGAIGSKMEAMGYSFDQGDLDRVIENLKGVIEKKRFASEDELEAVIKTVMRGR